jgi:uncharacterized protein YbjT (DUF2867 family)
MSGRTALLVGATGLVGTETLRLLAADPAWSKVVVLARKPADVVPAKVEWKVVSFDDPRAFDVDAIDDVFCCLGTTIKQAGSQEAFRRVDHDYPLLAAHGARKAGATRFLIITAMGSSKTSLVFYNRVKGEVEAALQELGFPRLVIVRPGLLMGHRQEHRAGEKLANAALSVLAPVLAGPLKKLRGIEGRTVAAALLELAKRDQPSLEIVENDRLLDLGGQS